MNPYMTPPTQFCIAETNFELTQDLENLQNELNAANEKISDLEQRVSALESPNTKG